MPGACRSANLQRQRVTATRQMATRRSGGSAFVLSIESVHERCAFHMYKFEILPQVLVPELADRFPLTTRCCACDHAVGQVTGVAAFYNVKAVLARRDLRKMLFLG